MSHHTNTLIINTLQNNLTNFIQYENIAVKNASAFYLKRKDVLTKTLRRFK